ncbi:MAG: putative nucleotidyltransferase with HDIG domain [Planctomycetota bacterium]|jgi:putative nucleotidyltransferase with HDIG domain
MDISKHLPGRKRNRRGLRRFSPERAKTGWRRQQSIEHLSGAGEKITVATVAGAMALVLMGLGADLSPRGWIGLGALMLTAQVCFSRYLLDFRRHALKSIGQVIGLAACLLVPLVVAQIMREVFEVADFCYLPLSFLSLVIALAWSRGLALDATAYAGGLLAVFLYLRPERDGVLEGWAVSMAGALTACLAADGIRRRVAVVRVGLLVGLVQVLVAGAFVLLKQDAPDPSGVSWQMFYLLIDGLVVGLAVSGALPAIERLFDVTTDVSLLELGNTHEQPLLRKLLLEAPGTFHHSYIVGLLSEAAAEACGANALLTRVGALYHDIGKLNKPGYFAENSPEARGRHKGLTPEMSTLIISSHTRDGVELGMYYGLPKSVLDFMPEHHGTSCIEYFFHSAQALRGEEHVNEEHFRYPGPRPQSIETAIVMIADAVEAISRQMPDPSRARLKAMVHEVVLKRLMDRQFDECGTTLRDLDHIESACVQVLMGIYHTRPTFPKGRPHPLDLSQPREDRAAVKDSEEPPTSKTAINS